MKTSIEFQDKIEAIIEEVENGALITEKEAGEWHGRIGQVIERLRLLEKDAATIHATAIENEYREWGRGRKKNGMARRTQKG